MIYAKLLTGFGATVSYTNSSLIEYQAGELTSEAYLEPIRISTMELILSFLSIRRLRVVLEGRSSGEYRLNTGVPRGSILSPILFLL